MLNVLDPRAARRWALAALAALADAREEIDALNVFPVPDGDTGTNLYLTLESAVAAAQVLPADAPVAAVADAFARGALLGARGNSGVIGAQMLRGWAEVLAEHSELTAETAVECFRRADEQAWKAVHHPVEGTILSVSRAAAQAAQAAAASDFGGDLEAVISAAAESAQLALARTPVQLPALAAAGVVDAGGRGLVVLLDALAEVVMADHTHHRQHRQHRRRRRPANLPALDFASCWGVAAVAPSAAAVGEPELWTHAAPERADPDAVGGREEKVGRGPRADWAPGRSRPVGRGLRDVRVDRDEWVDREAPVDRDALTGPRPRPGRKPGLGSAPQLGRELQVDQAGRPGRPVVLDRAGKRDHAGPGPVDRVEAGAPAGFVPHSHDVPPTPAAAGGTSVPNFGSSSTAPARYEVMFLLDTEPEPGDALVDELRERLDGLGDSLVIVGGPELWQVHVHTAEAGAAVEAAIAAGRPHQIRITHLGGSAVDSGASRAPARNRSTGLVACAAGPGLAELFESTGAVVVAGGPGRRPSTAAILAAIHRTGATDVAVLPNDADTLSVARIAAASARAEGIRVTVVPTRAQVQGLAAAAVHDPERRFDDDVVSMSAAAGAARDGAVTVAARNGLTSAGECRIGDALGVVDGDFAVIGADLEAAAVGVLHRLLASGGELVTIVVGAGGHDALARSVAAHARGLGRGLEVNVVNGGQPRYPLLIGVE